MVGNPVSHEVSVDEFPNIYHALAQSDRHRQALWEMRTALPSTVSAFESIPTRIVGNPEAIHMSEKSPFR
jgi:hypothetical protein